jgi:starvation-inducible outer membrane lipoprotein
MLRTLAAASFAGLLLAGCATIPVALGQNQAATRFIEIAQTTCGWEPTVATAVNLIAAAAGYGDSVSTITSIADQACALIKKPGAARRIARGKPPVLLGVPLHGRMVARR